MNEKILYISDLDGTLLRSDERISEYTAKVVNEFVLQGGYFSFATARSANTALKVTKSFNARFPIIVYNGTFITDPYSDEILSSNYFTDDEVDYLSKKMFEHNVCPMVYAYINGEQKFSLIEECINNDTKIFLNSRANDGRMRKAFEYDELYSGNVFYFTCIGTKKELDSLSKFFRLDARFNCVYSTDIYSGAQWLEILPLEATKSNAALHLKEILGCDKIISFGDNVNDLSLFGISDECYAVENAVLELKAVATAVIESNDNDGVAKWLMQLMK